VKAVHPEYADSAWRTAAAGCAVPGTVLPAPVSIGYPISDVDPSYRKAPAVDADGSYGIRWAGAATTPAGVTWVLQEAANSTFTANLRTVYEGPDLTAAVTDRATNLTYYYRVKVRKPGYKDSLWKASTGIKVIGIGVPAGTPISIIVPAADADGSYTVSWGASATKNVTYVLEEATDAAFTSNLQSFATGTARSKALTGRSQGVTYYYRVKAVHPEYADSAWRTAAAGCAVPGTVLGTPASISVPRSSVGGSYSVSWGASASSGVEYVLQEATNSTFTANLREAYRGVDLTTAISGRSVGVTYFYRVKAVKPGYKDSAWKIGANGCKVM
jgi:hypothetical protein